MDSEDEDEGRGFRCKRVYETPQNQMQKGTGLGPRSIDASDTFGLSGLLVGSLGWIYPTSLGPDHTCFPCLSGYG